MNRLLRARVALSAVMAFCAIAQARLALSPRWIDVDPIGHSWALRVLERGLPKGTPEAESFARFEHAFRQYIDLLLPASGSLGPARIEGCIDARDWQGCARAWGTAHDLDDDPVLWGSARTTLVAAIGLAIFLVAAAALTHSSSAWGRSVAMIVTLMVLAAALLAVGGGGIFVYRGLTGSFSYFATVSLWPMIWLAFVCGGAAAAIAAAVAQRRAGSTRPGAIPSSD